MSSSNAPTRRLIWTDDMTLHLLLALAKYTEEKKFPHTTKSGYNEEEILREELNGEEDKHGKHGWRIIAKAVNQMSWYTNLPSTSNLNRMDTNINNNPSGSNDGQSQNGSNRREITAQQAEQRWNNIRSRDVPEWLAEVHACWQNKMRLIAANLICQKVLQNAGQSDLSNTSSTSSSNLNPSSLSMLNLSTNPDFQLLSVLSDNKNLSASSTSTDKSSLEHNIQHQNITIHDIITSSEYEPILRNYVEEWSQHVWVDHRAY
jgi:hypothetical protein